MQMLQHDLIGWAIAHYQLLQFTTKFSFLLIGQNWSRGTISRAPYLSL